VVIIFFFNLIIIIMVNYVSGIPKKLKM